MMDTWGNIGVILLAYVVGATPFGYLASRANGIDIRDHGSGNIGATNVLRTLGKKVGIPVFFLDVLKGLIPVLLAGHFAGDVFYSLVPVLAAVATILGHNFTFWLGFKGGKGVATSAGALLGLMPVALAAGVVVWLAFFFSTRYVAVASIFSAATIPVAVAVRGLLSGGVRWPYLVLGVLVAVMVFVRHRTNIHRLLAGEEHRFERRKKPADTLHEN